MNAARAEPSLTRAQQHPERHALRLELGCFALLLALINLPMAFGRFASAWFGFHPELVRAGKWWRVLSHPLAHVSWYHLVLDATAFLLAYAELSGRRRGERLGLVAAAGAGSLVVAWAFSPIVAANGLCGLSGIAHGLTAVAGLELLRKGDDRWLRGAGLLCFAAVVGKCVIEALAGQVVFASWHLGSLGTPVAVSHAGGVLGAVVALLFFNANRTPTPTEALSHRGIEHIVVIPPEPRRSKVWSSAFTRLGAGIPPNRLKAELQKGEVAKRTRGECSAASVGRRSWQGHRAA